MTFNQVEYNKQRYHQNRDAFFAGKVCAHCGTIDELQVDHVDPKTKDPTLKNNEGRIWIWGETRRNAELAKCQPLCRPCHEAKTSSEGDNQHDFVFQKGIGNYNAKLTEDDVRQIRSMVDSGLSNAAVARHYHVSASTIGKIIKGLTWTHVQ